MLANRLFSTLYIDFRGESAKVLQGNPVDNSLNAVVNAYGTVELPGFLLPGIDKKNLQENASRLRFFLRDRGIKAKKVVAGLGQNGIIARNIRVPKLTSKDLDKMMQLEISDYLPVNQEEYAFDYKVLDEVEDEDRTYLELMVAAVNRNHAEQCTSLLEMVGLKPVLLDILPNMLHRLFGFMENRDIMVLDGGPEGAHLAIFKGKALFMYADIPFVINGHGQDDLSVLASEIRGYLDFFASRNFGKNIDYISVVGDLSTVEAIAEDLGNYMPVPVSVGLFHAGFLKFQGARSFTEYNAIYAGNLGLMMRGKEQVRTEGISKPKNFNSPGDGSTIGAGM